MPPPDVRVVLAEQVLRRRAGEGRGRDYRRPDGRRDMRRAGWLATRTVSRENAAMRSRTFGASTASARLAGALRPEAARQAALVGAGEDDDTPGSCGSGARRPRRSARASVACPGPRGWMPTSSSPNSTPCLRSRFSCARRPRARARAAARPRAGAPRAGRTAGGSRAPRARRGREFEQPPGDQPEGLPAWAGQRAQPAVGARQLEHEARLGVGRQLDAQVVARPPQLTDGPGAAVEGAGQNASRIRSLPTASTSSAHPPERSESAAAALAATVIRALGRCFRSDRSAGSASVVRPSPATCATRMFSGSELVMQDQAAPGHL